MVLASFPVVVLFRCCRASFAVGKTSSESARHAIEANKQCELIMCEISAKHPFAPGHFRTRPIVSGVLLLDYAIDLIGAALRRLLNACDISSVKLTLPAAPREPLTISLRLGECRAIRFAIGAGERTAAFGVPTQRQSP